MFDHVGNLIVKELIQFRRDRILAGFILLAPMLQLILMAQTTERGIVGQPVVVLDLDRSRLSRRLVTGLDNTEELAVQYHVDGMDRVRDLLDQGKARLAVIIPADFASLTANGPSPNQIQILADATNTVAASTVIGAASGVVDRFSTDLAGSSGMIVPQLVDFRSDIPFNPTMDVRAFTIPAQLGFITYQVTLAVASLGLARERELGTLEQLLVSPLRRFELTLGKGIPAVAIGFLNFLAMYTISTGLFAVPMNGSMALLLGLSLLFITAVVSWGLVISAVSRTQQQAILFVFIQAMVDMTFSGFLVPVKNMPPVLQMISRFVPLQYYLSIVRSIMLKGAGLNVLFPQALALAGLSLIMGFVAVRVVARRLD
jgi:ABC-2 type transport system permease protein